MKRELEIKILEIDETAVRERLQSSGARLEFDGRIRTASYDFSGPYDTHLFLSAQDGAEGLLAFADTRRGELLHTTVTDHSETAQILTMIGLENRGDMWRAPRKISQLDDLGYRLRLRRFVDERRAIDFGQLTLKTRKEIDTVKRMDEYETDLADYAVAQEILKRFGLRERRAYEKTRAEYQLRGGIKAVIDTIPGVPTFLEIEGPDDEVIEAAVRGFGYTMADASTLTGRELMQLYRKNGGD